jgi:YD repeat-containing protein
LGAKITTLYDAANEVTGVLDARSGLTQFQFDSAGLTSIAFDSAVLPATCNTRMALARISPIASTPSMAN